MTLTVPARWALAFYTGAQPAGQPSSPAPSGGRPIHPAAFSGKCLDIKDGSFTNGALVQLWDCGGNAQEQFVAANTGAPTAIQVAGTNFCLDVGSSPTNGAQLKIWTCYPGIAAQTWSFTQGGQISNQGQCVDMTSACGLYSPRALSGLTRSRRRRLDEREHHADLGMLDEREPEPELELVKGRDRRRRRIFCSCSHLRHRGIFVLSCMDDTSSLSNLYVAHFAFQLCTLFQGDGAGARASTLRDAKLRARRSETRCGPRLPVRLGTRRLWARMRVVRHHAGDGFPPSLMAMQRRVLPSTQNSGSPFGSDSIMA
jgi:hypothetical protein